MKGLRAFARRTALTVTVITGGAVVLYPAIPQAFAGTYVLWSFLAVPAAEAATAAIAALRRRDRSQR